MEKMTTSAPPLLPRVEGGASKREGVPERKKTWEEAKDEKEKGGGEQKEDR